MLREHGLWLARGDRRGYVAVDYKGEIYSLSRWSGVKTKKLKEKLGDPKYLPSTEEVKKEISQKMTQKVHEYIAETKRKLEKDREPLKRAITTLKDRHQNERQDMRAQHNERWTKEENKRSERLPHGFMGLWHRITGVYQKIRRLNELETQRCIRRDRNEEQNLIEKQLEERGRLQVHVQAKRETHHKTMQELGQDIANYKDMQDFSDRIQYHKQEHAHTYQ